MKIYLNMKTVFQQSALISTIVFALNANYVAGQQTLVGSINGSAAVSETGAAQYVIPIELPAYEGIKPDINLVYGSRSGYGLAGFGWDISGLSVISRAGKDWYHDNTMSDIAYNNDDAFYLDNNRLFPLNGLNGGDNTDYYTEVQHFEKIISKGQYFPEYFIVYKPDGSKWEYGLYGNSKLIIATKPNAPLQWYISRITDIFGNYIDFDYVPNMNGQCNISRISYGGNTKASLGHHTTINFIYITAEGQDLFYETNYIDGNKIEHKQLIGSIEININSNLWRKYKMIYPNTYYRVTSVELHDNTGKLFKSQVFNYNEYPVTYEENPIYSEPLGQNMKRYIYYTADFDGNGTSECLMMPPLYDEDSANTMITAPYPLNWSYSLSPDIMTKIFLPGDFDGNGSEEFFLARNNNGINLDLFYYENNAFHVITGFKSFPANTKFRTGDVNFDGKTDLIVKTSTGGSSTIIVYEIQFHGQNNVIPIASVSDNTMSEMAVGRLKGNICPEIITYSMKTYKSYIYSNGSLVPKHAGNFANDKFTYPVLCDFNGDGLTDYYTIRRDSNTISFNINNGNGFDTLGVKISSCNNFVAGDFDGDGATDFIFQVRQGYNYLKYIGNGMVAIDNIEWFDSLGNKSISGKAGGPVFTDPSTGFVGAADFNGDGVDEIIRKYPECVNFKKVFSVDNNLLNSVTDGYDLLTQFEYGSVKGNQNPGFTVQYPLMINNRALKVVTRLTKGDLVNTSYSYFKALIHHKGRGFLGFLETTTTDNIQGMVKTNYYGLDQTVMVPYVDYSALKATGNQQVSTYDYTWTRSTWHDNKQYLMYPSQINATDHITGISSVKSTVINTANGTITSVSETTGTGVSQVNRSEYVYTALTREGYVFYVPGVKTEYYRRTGKPERNFRTEFTYDADFRLQSMKLMTGTPYQKYYVYSNYHATGKPQQCTMTCTGYSQVTKTLYDATGRFVIQTTDADNLKTVYTYNAMGQRVSMISPGNLSTTFSYDRAGRLTKTVFPGNLTAEATITSPAVNGPPGVLYQVYKTMTGQPPVTEFFDAWNRQIGVNTLGFNNLTVKNLTEYNNKGLVSRSSLPFSASPEHWNAFTYDFINRVQTQTAPGVNISYNYNGLQNTVNDLVSGEQVTSLLDQTGMISESNTLSGTVKYYYNSLGQSEKIDHGNLQTLIGYDNTGYQTSLTDPDAGSNTYTYDALGQIVTTKRNNVVSSTQYYKTNGKYYKTAYTEDVFTHTYSLKTGLDSIIAGTNQQVKITYDSYLRPVTEKETIKSKEFITSFTYNSAGKISSVTYASGTAFSYIYDANGYLQKIMRGSNLVWELKATNARGQVTKARFGNNLTVNMQYDSRGYMLSKGLISPSFTVLQDLFYIWNTKNQLATRQDNYNFLIEDFTYDTQGRLITADRRRVPPPGLMLMAASLLATDGINNDTVNYDPTTGNILSKTGAGLYAYGTIPHAVTQVSGNPGTLSSVLADITYTSFDMVKTITQVPYYAEFTYGYDQQRRQMIVKQNGSIILTRYYNGNYELEEYPGGKYRKIHYIYAGDEPVAVYIISNMSGTVKYETYYLHTDHLGSVVCITNQAGQVYQQMSFDAWGNRRDPQTGERFTATPSNLLLSRGFTFHEHLDWFGLINMNGRLYNPVLSRFLSPDRLVQNPALAGSYNRYAYCMNNPLSCTDPSGWEPAPIYSDPSGGVCEESWRLYDIGDFRVWWDRGPTDSDFAAYDEYREHRGEASFSAFYKARRDAQRYGITNYVLREAENTKNEANALKQQAVLSAVNYVSQLASSMPGGYISVGFKDGSLLNFTFEAGEILVNDFQVEVAAGQGVNDVSQAGLNFIAGYEGYSATTYKDVAGLASIGYGHLIKSGESFGTLSKNAALQLLRKDASFAVNAVNKYVKVSLNQNQFDALTSLIFNIGAGAFSKSTVLRNVNSGNTLSIDKSFMMWNKARIDGVLTPVQGLTNRRQAEANLFLNGDY